MSQRIDRAAYTWCALFLSGVVVLGYSCYKYLRYGLWDAPSVASALRWLGVDWAHTPTDWIGLYAALEGFPIWTALIILSFLAYWLIASGQPFRSYPVKP